ncbi:MAG: DNA polymerase III subunit gamma/tau [Pseudomonadota bacterium]
MSTLTPGADHADGNRLSAYQVLARKYRPQNFDDLIGHEAMVRTLKNAFAADRIAHAYILTGVRGVGKTTTARILARALNYVSGDDEGNSPQIDMPEEGVHCRAIAESRHPDVMEMDAASRTGVGDIRELIEGVRYAPVEARYKVYIIDEVHMLSTAAFNALLKTLEEPPPHVKFIFATTEIRKVPVTVLSRCQRFDLRRIEPDVLAKHLSSIANLENVAVAEDGLAMIARAAEGSVRDGLSILDQAIVQHAVGNQDAVEIGAETVREMIGLADRTIVWDLLAAAIKGDALETLKLFREQYGGGAEPQVVLRDLLDITHLVTRVKAAGGGAASQGAAGEADAARAMALAEEVEVNALTRIWSLLMKGLTETQVAPDPAAAGEMALIRICFAADLPTPDEALRALKKKSDTGVGSSKLKGNHTAETQPAKAANQNSPTVALTSSGGDLVSPNSFEEVVRLVGAKRDAKLRTELESYVRLVSFEPGRISIALTGQAPNDLANRLALRLKEWTGSVWVISVDASGGADTIRDRRWAEVMSDPLVSSVLALFPGAEVTAIRELDGIAKPGSGDDDLDADIQEGNG